MKNLNLSNSTPLGIALLLAMTFLSCNKDMPEPAIWTPEAPEDSAYFQLEYTWENLCEPWPNPAGRIEIWQIDEDGQNIKRPYKIQTFHPVNEIVKVSKGRFKLNYTVQGYGSQDCIDRRYRNYALEPGDTAYFRMHLE